MTTTKPVNKRRTPRRPGKTISGASPVTAFLLTMFVMVLGIIAAPAAITPYSWQRFDSLRNPGADATGNNHPITSGFTGNGEAPSGTLPIVDNICVGGPLGPEGYFSGFSLRSRANQLNNQGTMFVEPTPQSTLTFTNENAWGNFFQTNDNWVVESWVLPSRNGAGNSVGVVFATGLNRNNRAVDRQSGVILECINGTEGGTAPALNDGHVWLRCHAICPPNVTNANGSMDFYIGPPVLIKTPTNAAWIHAAVVRDTVAGTVAWYTNGVFVGSTGITNVYTTNYFSCIGVAGTQDSGFGHTNPGSTTRIGIGNGAQPYEGYIAELRWSSFLPGQFSVTNLLTRRTAVGSPTVYNGPVIVKAPQSVTVWQGGAASFGCVAATDTKITYQWQRNSVNIANATNRLYVLESTSVGSDNGAQFRCILTLNSISVTSATATLTVLANNPAFVTGYSNAIMAETSLKAYFPMDGSGTTVNNVKDPTHNGYFTNAPFVFRSGNTNYAAGNQGLSFNLPNFEYTGGYGLKANENGYVQIAGDNPAYDFASASAGNGTIEAVLYADQSMANTLLTGGSSEVLVWFSSATSYNASGGNTKPGADYFTFGVDGLGGIHYRNSSGPDLLWTVPGGMLGKRKHIAFVFSNTTNVTCYVDGINLGSKFQASFGTTPPSASQPLTIGKGGGANADLHGYWRDSWRGSVDDLAIYGAALTQSQIQQHVYRLLNGGNNSAASIAAITPSKSLFTGFPVQVLNVTAGGNPPFTYQWRSNAVNLAGATNSSYSFNGTGVPAGVYPFSVVVQGAIGGSVTSAPVTLTVINPSGYASKVYASSGGGPKAFYPLTETSGTNILDWAGTHDGILSGGYALSVGNDGPVVGTGALRMFGTNASVNGVIVPSAVTVPYYPELNPENGGNFSQEFWYKPDNTNRTISAVSAQANLGNAKAGMSTLCGIGTDGVGQTTIRYWTMMYGKYNNLNQGVAQNSAEGVTPPIVGEWQHIVSVADGNNATVTVYVNGNPDFTQNVSYSQHPGDGSTTGGANQNYYAPYTLGNYNGTYAWPMEGRLSQVAIYDYALTFNDITNHTSQIWTPAIITLQPVGLTNIESLGTATLTANAVGVPNNYQWQKDGVDLVPSFNLDGSEHFPRIFNAGGDSQGVFSKKLVISQPKTNDSGSYQLKVINPLNSGGFTNTISVLVKFTNDVTIPIVTDVSARGTTISGPVLDEATGSGGNPTPAQLSLVEVKFSKRMDPSSATNPASYSISGGVTVTNVVIANSVADTKFGGDYRAVGLVTTGLTPGASYTLTVANVYDQATFSNKVVTSITSFTAPLLRANTAVWNYYYKLGTGNFISLQDRTNSAFPYVPQFTAALTNMSSDAVSVGQNLGNNPTFSGQSDNYVSTVTAWVTPTNTGYYEFFVNGDDAARLYLNPSGSDPAGAQWIGDSFAGDVKFNDLYAIPTHYQLTAGQPYFMQIVSLENTGTDQCRAGWRYLGTADAAYDGSGANGAWIVDATNLPPIQGIYLTAYAPAAPSISIQPSSIVAAAGVTTNLAVTAGAGTGLISYQWQINNGNTGGNTNRLFFAPLAFANFSANYKVIVSDGVLSSTSSVVSVTPPAPSLLASPTGKAVPQGLATSLTVTPATFSGQTNYQWKFSGNNVAGANYGGATARTMTIASMQATNAGPYLVVVNDGFNSLSLTSTVATLTLAANPMITNSFTGSILNLKFPTEVGPSYIVEFKNALTNGAWNILSTNNGTGSALTVPAVTTNAQQYFRLRMQ